MENSPPDQIFFAENQYKVSETLSGQQSLITFKQLMQRTCASTDLMASLSNLHLTAGFMLNILLTTFAQVNYS